jgi:hypothetical protein
VRAVARLAGSQIRMPDTSPVCVMPVAPRKARRPGPAPPARAGPRRRTSRAVAERGLDPPLPHDHAARIELSGAGPREGGCPERRLRFPGQEDVSVVQGPLEPLPLLAHRERPARGDGHVVSAVALGDGDLGLPPSRKQNSPLP